MNGFSPGVLVAIIALLVALGVLPVWFFLSNRIRWMERAASERWRYRGPFGGPSWASSPYEHELDMIIRDRERRYDIRLTWGARQLLMIPVQETAELGGSLSFGEVQESIEQLFAEMREQKSDNLPLPPDARSSTAVVRAFSKRFCNIPPFCDRTAEDRRR